MTKQARGRPRHPQVSEAIIDAVAGTAGVGKPAIYRRFRDKSDLVVAAIRTALPEMHRPQRGTPRSRLGGG